MTQPMSSRRGNWSSSGAAGSSVMSSEPGFINGTTSRATEPMAKSGTARMTTSPAGTAVA